MSPSPHHSAPSLTSSVSLSFTCWFCVSCLVLMGLPRTSSIEIHAHLTMRTRSHVIQTRRVEKLQLLLQERSTTTGAHQHLTPSWTSQLTRRPITYHGRTREPCICQSSRSPLLSLNLLFFYWNLLRTAGLISLFGPMSGLLCSFHSEVRTKKGRDLRMGSNFPFLPFPFFFCSAKYGPSIERGQWWRFIAPMFLHIGLLHYVLSTLWLPFALPAIMCYIGWLLSSACTMDSLHAYPPLCL